ncbi:hypothetical protein CMI37_00790 [Candidatus Pacearchaeota archaeon]|nr:hypothetical protein [Candidatus Pacearchaeota archaeon]|tara:strand:+ start:2224 stop:2583 length:360 start_codon:yes stop_codon:yes gene_type:complete
MTTKQTKTKTKKTIPKAKPQVAPEPEAEKVISEEEAHVNKLLAMVVEPDSDLKNMLVEHVGTKLDQEEVTVHMIAEILALEFPEFIVSLAEENFLRGYQLGLDDAYKSITGIARENTAE